MERKPDALLGFITGPTVGIWFMRSLIDLFKNDADLRFAADYIAAQGPYIHENRNKLTELFLQTDRDWLFMVDNDMVFEPRDVFALLDEAGARGPGIYSAPYSMESGNFVCGPWGADDADIAYHPLASVPEVVCPIGMVGAGFTLIHRTVFESVGAAPWSSIDGTIGEDVSFMWRAKEVGWTPWLVPTHPGHTKSVVLYADGKTTNLYGENINLAKVDLTDPIFRQFQEKE